MVHVFEQRPVDRALVDDLLDIARRGPSAGFAQGTDFLVLDDHACLGRFWELTDDPRFRRGDAERTVAPPVVVLAFADPDRYREPDKVAFGLGHADAWPVRFWDTDTAMACMLLLLAAVDAGLGGWLFGITHGLDEICSAFDVPADRNLIAAVGLGYAGLDESPRGSAYSRSRRPLAEIVHRNGW
jgi:nitroreductase